MNLKSLAVICAACVWSLSAQAEVLVYEGFDTVSDYKGADAKKGSALNSGPATRTQSIGLSADKWGLAGGTQPRFFANDKGLSLPSAMIDAGFSALGTAIGFNPASTTAQVRPAYKKLADNLLKRDSGSLYFRCLIKVDATAAGVLAKGDTLAYDPGNNTAGVDANYYGAGLFAYPASNNYLPTVTEKPALAFYFLRNAAGNYKMACSATASAADLSAAKALTPIILGDAHTDKTSICYAQIDIDPDGEETVTVGYQDVADYDPHEDKLWTTSFKTELVSSTAYPSGIGIAGAYGMKGYALIDEFCIGTELSDVLYTKPSVPVVEDLAFILEAPKVGLEVTLGGEIGGKVEAIAARTDEADHVIVIGENLAAGATECGYFTDLTADSTYAFTVRTSVGADEKLFDAGIAYSGVPTLTKVQDGSEAGIPVQFTISRADASDLPLTVNYAITSDNAEAGVDYEPVSGVAVIPAGETSVMVEIIPLTNDAKSADSTFVVTLLDGNYFYAAQETAFTIVNADYNVWIAAEESDGLASTAANWSKGVPTTESDILLKSTKDLTWDAGVNGLPTTVKSWTQPEAYTGTVTILTTFPDYAGSDFKTFTITELCDLRGGTWTHPVSVSKPNDPTKYTLAQVRNMRSYRLNLEVGSLTVGPNASITAKGKGMYQSPTTSSGRAATYGVATHGGMVANSWFGCYGDVKRPEDIGVVGSIGADGSGTKHGAGGGAIKIKAKGAVTVDGLISADGQRGTGSSLAAGSAGSILIEAQSVSGSGTICADGVSCGNTSQTNGSAGRIAVYTEMPVDCSTLTLSAGAMTTGGKIAASGTIYLKDATTPNGILRVVNRFSTIADAEPGKTVPVTSEGDWTFDAIVLGGQVNLSVGADTTLTLPNGFASVSAPDNASRASGIFYRGGTINLGSGAQTLEGKWYFAPTAAFAFPDDVTLVNGSAIGFPNPYSQSKVETEAAYNKLEKILCSVAGDLTVSANCAVTATGAGAGYTKDTPPWYALAIGSHGGSFSMRTKAATEDIYSEPTPTHDSVFAPHLIPLQTQAYAYVRTGSAIALTVSGCLTLEGSIASDGADSGGCVYYATPGALDVTAGSIRGAGTISASARGTGQAGGRIAVKLTDKDADFSAFTGVIRANNNELVNPTIGNNSYMSSPGSIYLEKGNDGAKHGEVRIHGATAGLSTIATPICATGYGADEVADFKNASLVLSGSARASVAVVDAKGTFKMNNLVMTDQAKLDLCGHAFSVKKATIGGTKLKPGTYKASDAGLVGFVTDSSSGATGSLVVTGGGIAIIVR